MKPLHCVHWMTIPAIMLGGLLLVAAAAAQTATAPAMYPEYPSETPAALEPATDSFDNIRHEEKILVPKGEAVKALTRQAFVFFALSNGTILAPQSNGIVIGDDAEDDGYNLTFTGATIASGGGAVVPGFSFTKINSYNGELKALSSLAQSRWNNEDTVYANFELHPSGGGPAVYFRSVPVHLRRLETLEFLFVKDGTVAPLSVTGVPFTPGNYMQQLIIPAATTELLGATLSMNAWALDVTGTPVGDGTPAGEWNVDEAKITLVIQTIEGGGPNSCTAVFDGHAPDGSADPNAQPTLTLRQMETATGTDLVGYQWVRGQTAGGSGIVSPLPSDLTVTGAVTGVTGLTSVDLDSSLSLALTAAQSISPTYPATGTIAVQINSAASTKSWPTVTCPVKAMNFTKFVVDDDPNYTWHFPFETAANEILAANRTLVLNGGLAYEWSSFSEDLTDSVVTNESPLPFAGAGLLLNWALGEIKGGDSGEFTVTVDHPTAGYTTTNATVTVIIDNAPSTHTTVRQVGRTDSKLTPARRNLPYAVQLEALNHPAGDPTNLSALTVSPGQELHWHLEPHPPLWLEKAVTTDISTDPDRNFIRTDSVGDPIPNSWTSPQTLTLIVTKRDTATGDLLEGGAKITLIMEVVDPFPLLIDDFESGDMSAWSSYVP